MREQRWEEATSMVVTLNAAGSADVLQGIVAYPQLHPVL